MKLLIMCQEKILADALTSLLEESADLDLKIVGQVDNGIEGVQMVQDCRPDVALVSIQLHELNGIDVTRRIMESDDLQVGILILASDPKTEPLREALEAGALGYIAMDSGGEELVRALQTVAAGSNYLCPEAATALVESTIKGDQGVEDPVFSLLSPREREVLQLLAEGWGAKEVADKLNISSKTVDSHRRNIMKKLETDSLADLVKHAIRAGLTTLKT